MTLLHCSKTTLMAILLLVLGYSHKTLVAQEGRVRYAQTPQIDSAYAKGVSGHMAVLSRGYLLMAGGCNFPDKSALEGGKRGSIRTYTLLICIKQVGRKALIQ